jgi:hypothetical protein
VLLTNDGALIAGEAATAEHFGDHAIAARIHSPFDGIHVSVINRQPASFTVK